MIQTSENVIEEYLEDLPEGRREIVSALRNTIVQNMPHGYEETVISGVISYQIPLADYSESYNGSPLNCLALGNRKNYVSLHLTCYFESENQKKIVVDGFERANKKLNIGKSCIRFRNIDDIPLDVIAELAACIPADEMITQYEASRA